MLVLTCFAPMNCAVIVVVFFKPNWHHFFSFISYSNTSRIFMFIELVHADIDSRELIVRPADPSTRRFISTLVPLFV